MNAIDKLLVRFMSSSAAGIGELNEDLSPVFAAAPAFYQSPFFEAINSANHGCRVDTQMTGNAANSAGFPGSLGFFNQAQDDKLGCAKPVLVSVLESCAQHFAQVQECSSKLFYLLINCWLFL